MRYTVPVKIAQDAVGHASLFGVLESLLANRVIRSFEITDDEVSIVADPGLELSFLAAPEPRAVGTARVLRAVPGRADDRLRALRERDAGRLHAETTAAYYAQAQAFVGTRAFKALPPKRRAVWRLHARGLTKYEIVEELGIPQATVAQAILAVRPLAGLRRTERSVPRGPQKRKST